MNALTQPTDADNVICPGCGASVPAFSGATHAYLGEAPGCWALYGEVLAREYSDYRFGRVHHLTVDSYAAQHPGKAERRTIQSVAVHLIGLYLSLERGVEPRELMRARQATADRSARFHWLEPPDSRGAITVVDVHGAGEGDAEAHGRVVKAWGESVWEAWAGHHAQVREWAREIGSGKR
ncbi:MAG: DUF5946 family protein [Gemmatimonadaceae bacterium]